jgi:integrase
VAEIVRGMLAAGPPRPSTRTGWEGVAKGEILASALGRRQADQPTSQDVRRWVRAIAERRAHGANRALAVLKRAYSWALERDLVPGNPCVGVRKPTAEAQSDRVLTDAELWALLSSLRLIDRVAGRQHDESILAHVAATRLLLLTVVRRDAALGARREEFAALDGPEARWVVPGGRAGRSKSGRPHVVPLSPAAAAIVRQRLSEARGPLLFPRLLPAAGAPEKAMVWRSDFVAALRRLVVRRIGVEVPRWTIHNFRTAFATHARESLSIYGNEVPLILGHALPGPSITRIYDRSELPKARRAALTRWAEWLAGLRRPKRA